MKASHDGVTNALDVLLARSCEPDPSYKINTKGQQNETCSSWILYVPAFEQQNEFRGEVPFS